jgi:pimeloyl-ACP methyl ester carboxylesterase
MRSISAPLFLSRIALFRTRRRAASKATRSRCESGRLAARSGAGRLRLRLRLSRTAELHRTSREPSLSSETFRNAQQAAAAVDVIALMDALKIDKAIVAGFDWGARTADIVAALWPERRKALVSVSGYLITSLKANEQPLPPAGEWGWWYQYYFATERGRIGHERYRRDFNRLIWKNCSPKWDFDDATFDRTAASFSNPDHVDIVIHNYRWRLSLAKGEAQYDELERKLGEGPVIATPTITIASDFDGAAADGAPYAKKFSGRYSPRIFRGIGHNVPQEAPQAFAQRSSMSIATDRARRSRGDAARPNLRRHEIADGRDGAWHDPPAYTKVSPTPSSYRRATGRLV